ncbi:helix-turn-helix domain-containing protein [Streptomyces sp. BPTC-684]|uniref:TetR/AcrR family transcriptional regulator n=1 Tax=Streptomyces sp. BPTC-684 TaxID=3043734 RepID=UPI0024B22039|nr:helix-turn-helix domain-containing protein [Streptomyces sp. BPTC-684]WHM38857.1 helix-turn-helix domain-containing protein [Streptomyces sp. BPTC-684]
MARTKEFDPDAALQSAMTLFWRRGSEATSMADLVEYLGIGRASICATFGNKHELYLKALDRYGETYSAILFRELSAPGPALPAVRAVVRRFAAESAAKETRLTGCFVTNTAAEVGAHDTAAARLVEHAWEQLETLLHAALVRAGARRTAAGARPRALARLFLAFMQGMRVMGKVSDDPARLREAAEAALTLLD